MDLTSINYQPLFQKICETLGKEIDLKMDFSGKRPDIVSPNLISLCGPFQAICTEVEVGIFSQGTGDEDRFYWMNVSLFYKHKSGGGNGSTMFDAWYYAADQSWKFRMAGKSEME